MTFPRLRSRSRLLLASTASFVVLATSANASSANASSANASNANASSANASSANASNARWAIPYEKYQLANGLEVILHRDTAIPLVAVNVWYHVGPANEPPGRSGFAHLFEHLMFEGSKFVGPNFDRLLEAVGATNSNGTTSWDRTNYFETVPREHLELVLWIESDRMGFLRDAITQERLDVQREVVKNERRQSYENAPYGPSALALLDTLFPSGHPYHGAIIGSMQDLSAATLADVHAFANSYYAPSNATLTIAGDFEIDTVKRWVEKYFATLRKVARPSSKTTQSLPVPNATRLVVHEPVKVAKVAFGWVAPPAFALDHAPLTVLATILADGKSSRLYRHLVVDERIAVDVDAEMDPNALASLFTIDAQVSSGVAVDLVERALTKQIELVTTAPPNAQELERAKKRLRLQLENELEVLNAHGGDTGRAGLLQRFNHYVGNPGALTQWVAAIEGVTVADVSRVAAQHLGPNRRVTVVTQPVGSQS